MKKTKYPPEFVASVIVHNKNTALYEAIEKKGDDVEGVITAVNNGAELNSTFKGRLPLEWAIHFGKFERFKTLLNIIPPQGAKPLDITASVFVTDKKIEMSFLHYAAVKGLSQFVEYLAVQKKMDTTLQDKHGRRLLPIHHAAGSGSCATVDVLNNQQQAITAVSGEGDFCIHLAVMRGKIKMVEHLLVLGADVNCRNYEGRTPLHCAVLWRQKEMVAFLLTKKASTQDVDNRGRNAYLLAVHIGEIDLVDSLVLAGDSHAIEDSNGMNAMHIAAENNNVAMIKFLGNKKGLFVDVKDTTGRIPIHIATQHDFIDVFNFLINDKRKKLLHSLAKKVDPSILEKAVIAELQTTLLSWQDNKGDTVIEYAVRAKSTKILARLAELGIKLDRTNNLGYTLMHEAAEEGDVEKVGLLTRYGVGTNKKNNASLRPEHVAAKNGKITVLAALMKVPGVDFKAKDDDGMMPIHWAASGGHKDTLEWLLNNSGGRENLIDNHGRNCLFHAVRGDHAELVAHLVKVRKMSLSTLCSKKMTVMHHAVFKSAKKTISTLKDFGMSLEAKSGDQGMLPLHVACRSGLSDMVDFLVQQSVNKDACNDSGRNAWFYAAAGSNSIEIFTCLEKHNVPLYGVLDKHGLSPVHAAAIGGNIIGLKFLLDKGLSHSAQSKAGETPLKKATINRERVEKELIEKKNSPEYRGENNMKLLEECEKLEARLLAYKDIENHLIALHQQAIAIEEKEEPREKQTEEVTKRGREDEPHDRKAARVIKPKLAIVDQKMPMKADPEHHTNQREDHDEPNGNQGPKM